MMCSSPIITKNRYGEICHSPCGMCKACRINYRNEWKMRFAHELKAHDVSTWLQLSYSDDGLAMQNEEYFNKDGKLNSLEREELTKWIKRFREEVKPLKIRYFGCGEYGDEKCTMRPHYHMALFGIAPEHPAFGKFLMHARSGTWRELKSWPYGMVWVDKTPPTLSVGSYIAKYIMKKHKGKGADEYYKELGLNPEFCCMSLKPGIGAAKIDEFADYYWDNPVFYLNGKKVAISRYMKERIAMKKAIELCKYYVGRDDYEDHLQVEYENMMRHWSELRQEYNEKYGLTPVRFGTAAEQWEKFGQQQERNLKNYE